MSLPNLLSKQEKGHYNRYLYLLGLRRVFYAQAVAALIVIALFTAGHLYYSSRLNDLKERSAALQLAQKDFDGTSLQATVEQQSKSVSVVYEVLKVNPSMSRILDELIRLVPAGVTIDSMIISTRDEARINFSGRAVSRDQVVTLTSRLQTSDFFDVVYAPLSNLTEPADTPFTFIISFDLEDVVVSK